MMKLTEHGLITMVDDNPADIVLARTCFELSKLTNPWRSFPSGELFLSYLEGVKSAASPMPALVLLDINMPRMTGHEVLGYVRTDPYFAELPVFCMLTSSGDPKEQERAEALGATGFVTKPDDPDDYIAFFDSLVPA